MTAEDTIYAFQTNQPSSLLVISHVLLLVDIVNIYTPWEQKLPLNHIKMVDMWITDYVNLIIKSFIPGCNCSLA